LIEMLLVITIIVILAALLLPAVREALKKSEIAKADATIKQLAAALQSYQTEFGVWPTNSASELAVSDGIVNLLAGQNPRGRVFLQVESKSWRDGGYRDPWGQLYRCKFDQGYADSTAIPGSTSRASLGVLVWSIGPTGTTNTNVYRASWW
jgi:type II secretory pathway pseudopilin PulG